MTAPARWSNSSSAMHCRHCNVIGCTLRWDGGKAQYQQGECWFMPASLKSYELIPADESLLIRTFVPDLNALRGNLRMLGIADSKISDVVFE